MGKHIYISRTEHEEIVRKLKAKGRKKVKILTKAIQDLNRTSKKLKEQESFLNEILDKREFEIKELKVQLGNWKFKVKGEEVKWKESLEKI